MALIGLTDTGRAIVGAIVMAVWLYGLWALGGAMEKAIAAWR